MRPILFFITIVIILSENNDSFASSIKYYRSISSGLWHDPSIWQTADDINFTINPSNSQDFPDNNSHQITIQNGNIVTISQSINIDETIINNGGELIYGNYTNSSLTIEDGPGTDLIVYGTFEESGPFSIIWNNAASWQIGNSGTLIRTRSTSATTWRDNYETGMKNIPATSNWIIRKQGSDNPSISAINTYYGNLFIENMTVNLWDAISVGSRFTGFGGFVTIKGNLNVGGNGINGVKFYIENSNVNPAKILGNTWIKNNSTLYLDDASSTTGATGIEMKGDITIDGTIAFNPMDANTSNRQLIFSGTSDQYINGSGILNIYNLMINKSSGNLILNRNIAIDRSLILQNGCLNLNSHQLSIYNNNPNAIQRNSGWVKSETNNNSSKIIWTLGNSYGMHTFPFGKNDTTYIPFSFELISGNAGDVIVSTYATNAFNLPLPYYPILVTNIENQPEDINSRIVDRFWQIDVTGNNPLANLTFAYDDLEEPFDEADLFASRYDVSNNTWQIPMLNQVSNATNNDVIIKNVQSFSAWTLNGNGIALHFNDIENPPFIMTKENDLENIEIVIYDLLGRLIAKNVPVNNIADKKSLFFELQIQPGIYVIKSITKNSITSDIYIHSELY